MFFCVLPKKSLHYSLGSVYAEVGREQRRQAWHLYSVPFNFHGWGRRLAVFVSLAGCLLGFSEAGFHYVAQDVFTHTILLPLPESKFIGRWHCGQLSCFLFPCLPFRYRFILHQELILCMIGIW